MNPQPTLSLPPRQAGGPSLRILVVDDLLDAADSLALLLGLMGHVARAVYDGPTALREASTFRPDVVLLDLCLPRMDGYEVARRLRGEMGLSDALLVATTGLRQEERCIREAGFDRLFLKPLDLTELERLLAVAPSLGDRPPAELPCLSR
jgi:two-component system CheB/CheR fusion protein